MKVAELLESRRRNWQELDLLCQELKVRRRKTLGSARMARFAALYRAACADLALADSYQLPPNTVQYLHQLVGRAHNQLYRSRVFNLKHWSDLLLSDVPQKIFNDHCVQFAFCFFWGIFIISAILASSTTLWPEYAEAMIGQDQIEVLESNFAAPLGGRDPVEDQIMASFYIQHNTSIGLQCFALGILIVPGLFVTLFNSAFLGACFGYMARPDVYAAEGKNFFHFVTAHGPFELTAIVLSFGSGLRLGMSLLRTNGLTRMASLTKTAKESMPIMGAAMLLFVGAAIIEGFLSPSKFPAWFEEAGSVLLFGYVPPDDITYLVKAIVALFCSGLLMFYFVVLGFPRRMTRGT